MQEERKGVILFKGNMMTLVGPEVKVGERAPDFAVVDTGLNKVTLADFAGKVKVISAVPSLDTPVCDTETRRFNQEAAHFRERGGADNQPRPPLRAEAVVRRRRDRSGHRPVGLSGAGVRTGVRGAHQGAEASVPFRVRHRRENIIRHIQHVTK